MRSKTQLEPYVSVMKCARNRTTCARSVVQCYASGEVRCGTVVSVVISICVIELSVPVFHIVVLILLVVVLQLFISLVSRSHFSHTFFSVFSRHFRCGIHTGSGSLSGRMFVAHKGSCDALRKRT